MKICAAEKILICLKNGLITERDCSLHAVQKKLPNKIIMIYLAEAHSQEFEKGCFDSSVKALP